MAYRFRVTLAGLKGFLRVYEMAPETTLYDFHKQMRADMEFAQDQLILFKALSPDGEVVGRYGLFGPGPVTVDKITVAEAVKNGTDSFVYFYDVPNKKSVIVTFDGCTDAEVEGVALVETKGPNPIEFENGFVAYEDLPETQRHLPGQKPVWDMTDDDDDDGDDDEDDDDDDGKEVFDGTEDLAI